MLRKISKWIVALRHIRALALLVLAMGAWGWICTTPQPPACRTYSCVAGTDSICNKCRPVTATEGATCTANLCEESDVPRCDSLQQLRCVDGHCAKRENGGYNQSCSGDEACSGALFCKPNACPAQGDGGVAPDAGLDGVCYPYVVTDNNPCDSDERTPPGTARCAPCLQGLLCIEGTCQRPCTLGVSQEQQSCGCYGSRCREADAGVPDVVGLCRACRELGSGQWFTGPDAPPRPACCEEGQPGVIDSDAGCCRETGATGCTTYGECCGGACEPSVPAGNGMCHDCIAQPSVCTADWQCCGGGRCSGPAGAMKYCCDHWHGTCAANAQPCSTNFMFDVNNCGDCGHHCTIAGAHQTVACLQGACGQTCEGGFANCNNLSNDGCEINVNTDPLNCGWCGNACGSGMVCNDGSCTSCPGSQTNCAGVCRELQSDRENCGACGHVCGGGMRCNLGTCVSCSAEICNGIDDDCNGAIDDNIAPSDCQYYPDECQLDSEPANRHFTGHTTCVAGVASCAAEAGVDYCNCTSSNLACGRRWGESCVEGDSRNDCGPNLTCVGGFCDLYGGADVGTLVCCNSPRCWSPNSLPTTPQYRCLRDQFPSACVNSSWRGCPHP